MASSMPYFINNFPKPAKMVETVKVHQVQKSKRNGSPSCNRLIFTQGAYRYVVKAALEFQTCNWCGLRCTATFIDAYLDKKEPSTSTLQCVQIQLQLHE